MDHGVGPRRCKICDWLVHLSGLHQGKNECQSGQGVRGPHKTYFEAYLHCPLMWSNGFWGGRGERGALVEKGKEEPMAEK